MWCDLEIQGHASRRRQHAVLQAAARRRLQAVASGGTSSTPGQDASSPTAAAEKGKLPSAGIVINWNIILHSWPPVNFPIVSIVCLHLTDLHEDKFHTVQRPQVLQPPCLYQRRSALLSSSTTRQKPLRVMLCSAHAPGGVPLPLPGDRQAACKPHDNRALDACHASSAFGYM